ncbi:MAG: integrin alpha, partial [Gammaproteobacteria bacterium]
GDVNGDGYDDILIGVYRETPNGVRSGSSYVVFGRGDGFAARLVLSDIDGTNGIRLDGATAESGSGAEVSGAGDVNGDGFDDLLIGAPVGNPNLADAGAAYVVHGRDFNGVVTRQGGAASDTLSGTNADENFVGGLGDDLLDGGGGADVLRGGGGTDTLVWRDGLRRADGGGGEDRLRLIGAGVTLDLTVVSDSRIIGIERIDLTGSGDNTLRLAVRDVLALPDASGMFLDAATRQLVVEGDTGDRVEAGGQGWVAGQDVTLAGELYATYTHADAAVTLLIDSALTRDLS